MGEENNTLSLRDALAQGFARTDGMTDDQMLAENNGMSAQDAGIPADGTAPGDTGAAPADMQATETPADGTQPVEPIPQAAQEPAPTPQVQPDANAQMFQLMMTQMQQLQAQNQQLQQALAQQQNAMQEQSQAAENAMDTAMTQPSITVPVLDFNELQYDDDATRAQKIGDWQNALVKSIKDEVAAQYASQLAPIREEYEAKQRQADMAAAKNQLYGDPRFADFRDRDAQIENILSSVPELNGLSADKRYLLGGMIARGMAYQAQPSAEDLVRQVQANPDALRMLDAERARTIADRNGQIPTIMPSAGMSTANAIPENIPKSMDELHARTSMALRRG